MKIIWRDEALSGLEDALYSIAQHNPAAAKRIFDDIQEAVQRLAHAPESGRPGRVEGTRELVVPHTPYLIAYTVLAGTVDILAVQHHAQEWPEQF